MPKRSSRRRDRRRAIGLLAAGLALLVVLGFAGELLPVFDSMGHLRLQACAALVLVSLALLAARRWGMAAAGLAVATAGFLSTAAFVLPALPVPSEGAPSYTLLQMNLRSEAFDREQALSLIARLRPDVVTAQEMTPEWQEDFARLRTAYPFQFYCREPFLRGSDTAILSRRPFVDEASAICNEAGAFSAARIDFNGLVATIGSQHLRWPWPGRQASMIEALLPDLRRLGGPTIVAGDFNAAPWSAAIRRYADASRTRVVAGIGPTWLAFPLPSALIRFAGLPIDNVLASNDIEVLDVQALAPTSSDHLPVLVTFTLRFALPEEPDVQSASR